MQVRKRTRAGSIRLSYEWNGDTHTVTATALPTGAWEVTGKNRDGVEYSITVTGDPTSKMHDFVERHTGSRPAAKVGRSFQGLYNY